MYQYRYGLPSHGKLCNAWNSTLIMHVKCCKRMEFVTFVMPHQNHIFKKCGVLINKMILIFCEDLIRTDWIPAYVSQPVVRLMVQADYVLFPFGHSMNACKWCFVFTDERLFIFTHMALIIHFQCINIIFLWKVSFWWHQCKCIAVVVVLLPINLPLYCI